MKEPVHWRWLLRKWGFVRRRRGRSERRCEVKYRRRRFLCQDCNLRNEAEDEKSYKYHRNPTGQLNNPSLSHRQEEWSSRSDCGHFGWQDAKGKILFCFWCKCWLSREPKLQRIASTRSKQLRAAQCCRSSGETKEIDSKISSSI